MTKFKRVDSVVSKTIEEQVVILDLQEGFFYTLNDTAGDIWNFISKPKSEDEIISYLVQKYNEDETKVKKDVEKFINKYKDSLIKTIS
jgi:hypothetical protein